MLSIKVQELKQKIEGLNYHQNKRDYDVLNGLTDELRSVMRPISNVEHICNRLRISGKIQNLFQRTIDEKAAEFEKRKLEVLEQIAQLELLIEQIK
jgi:hypothetical protein